MSLPMLLRVATLSAAGLVAIGAFIVVVGLYEGLTEARQSSARIHHRKKDEDEDEGFKDMGDTRSLHEFKNMPREATAEDYELRQRHRVDYNPPATAPIPPAMTAPSATTDDHSEAVSRTSDDATTDLVDAEYETLLVRQQRLEQIRASLKAQEAEIEQAEQNLRIRKWNVDSAIESMNSAMRENGASLAQGPIAMVNDGEEDAIATDSSSTRSTSNMSDITDNLMIMAAEEITEADVSAIDEAFERAVDDWASVGHIENEGDGGGDGGGDGADAALLGVASIASDHTEEEGSVGFSDDWCKSDF